MAQGAPKALDRARGAASGAGAPVAKLGVLSTSGAISGAVSARGFGRDGDIPGDIPGDFPGDFPGSLRNRCSPPGPAAVNCPRSAQFLGLLDLRGETRALWIVVRSAVVRLVTMMRGAKVIPARRATP